MPTKPLNEPEIWALNALYTTGPFIGSASKVVPPGATAAEGHRPGNLFPTPAEYENSQQNRITALCQWVFDGTFDPDPDAHIVETNSAGRASLAGLDVDDLVNETAVVITGNAVVAPAVTITNTTGGSALACNIGNSNAGCISASVGNLAGIGLAVDLTGTQLTGYGVAVYGDAATDASGFYVTQAGNGIGVEISCAGSGRGIDLTTSGSGIGLSINTSAGTATACSITGNSSATAVVVAAGAGRAAINATAGSNASAAVIANGNGTSLGVDGLGGSGSSAATGVRGTAVHADAVGVYGRTSTTGTTTSAGVVGEGRGTNESIGVKAISASGYALWIEADNVAPVSPAVYLKPQNGPPSNAASIGDLYCESGMRQVKHGTGNGYHSFYQGGDSESSASMVQFSSEGPFTSNSTVLWTTTLSPYLADSLGNGYYGVSTGAELTITIVLNPRTQTAANATLSLQVIDNSDGGTVIFTRDGTGTAVNDGYRLLSSTTNWLGSITIMFQYAPPNEGDLNLQIDIRVGDGGGANIEARDVGCQIWGTFVP